MNIMKKISALLLMLCLCAPCFSLVVHAADGRISFTDPETAVGDTVEIKCAVRSTSGKLGDVEVKLAYDTESLRFDSGDGVTDDGDGALTYSGFGSSSEVSFTMTFQALKEGTAKVSVSSTDISSGSGTLLDMEQGSSSVKIAAGDPSKITEDGISTVRASDKEVEVNGKVYILTDDFADADIPSGYSRTQVSLDGEERQMVTNTTNSVYLAYLIDADKVGDFFLYNNEDATFVPYEEVSISDNTSIIILSDTSKVKLPKKYKEAKLTLNDKEFPVWQDSKNDGFYVLYAMNNNGETGYYQYDSQEGTYQRAQITSADDTTSKKKNTSSLLGKLQDFFEKHMQLIVLIGGLGLIIILLVIIILGVKLHNRNAELDDLYEEYGIDVEEEEPIKTVAKEKLLRFGKHNKATEDEFEGFAGYDDAEDDFGEDDYDEDGYLEDDFDPEDDFDEESFRELNPRAEHEELTIDDLNEFLSDNPKKKRGHMEEDDTFKVDFIDLD